MKDNTREWVNLDREDLRDAKILFAGKSYKNCVLHCHQSIEKILKAIIVEKDQKLYRIHDLIELVEDAAIDLPKEYARFCDNLSPHYLGTKYPDIAIKFEYTRKSVDAILKTTQEVFRWLQHELTQR